MVLYPTRKGLVLRRRDEMRPTFDGSYKSQPNTTIRQLEYTFTADEKEMKDQRVSAGRLDQRVSRLYAAGALRLFDHAQSDPVLDASPGIEVFQFRIYGGLDPETLWESVQPDKRGVADVLGDGIESQRGHGGGCYGGHVGMQAEPKEQRCSLLMFSKVVHRI